MIKKSISLIGSLALVGATSAALAEISADEAARLGQDLTPVGAQMAGNADGTIPAWTGGITEPLPGWPNEDNYRPNPHADDEILFTITAENVDQYADKLPEAAKAMFRAYPQDFKMNIYPSRRTAAYPQWYYDAIKTNATTARLINDGNGVEGVWGSVPFPIPQNGNEVIWNHMLRFQAISRTANMRENIIYANGSRLDYLRTNVVDYAFYAPEPTEEQKAAGDTTKYSHTTIEPSRDAGDGLLAIENIDPVKNPRKAWQYDPGERRVRRAPNLSFDTPDLAINTIDDFDIFSGSPEKYDWKLVGKKEMYVPYNNNEINSPRRKLKETTPPNFLDSDALRYELHRVWVVEATVAEGKRHIYARRVFYIDEDTWNILVSDKYDNSSELWRVAFAYPVVAPEVPTTAGAAYVHVDLKKNGYYLAFNTLESNKGWDYTQPQQDAKFFTPAALRRRGR